MTQVNIPMDETVKAEAEQLFQQLGLTFSSAVNMFVLQAIEEGGIPFMVTTKAEKSERADLITHTADKIIDDNLEAFLELAK